MANQENPSRQNELNDVFHALSKQKMFDAACVFYASGEPYPGRLLVDYVITTLLQKFPMLPDKEEVLLSCSNVSEMCAKYPMVEFTLVVGVVEMVRYIEACWAEKDSFHTWITAMEDYGMRHHLHVCEELLWAMTPMNDE